MAVPGGYGATQQSILQGTAPEQQANQAALQGIAQQQALVGPETASQEAYSAALGGIQNQQYGIQNQQTQLSQLENTQQSAQNVTQQGIEQTGYGLQQGAYGLQGQELGIQGQQQQLAYNNALQSQQNSGAASGTTYTHGQNQALGTLTQNKNLSDATLGLQGSLLNNQSAQSANTQQGEQSGFQFNQQQLGNAQTNLGLVAQANGLSNQQALTMLNFQSQQAGLQGAAQSSQLLSQAGQTALSDESAIGSSLGLEAFAQGASK
jgi:hypothetical protein